MNWYIGVKVARLSGEPASLLAMPGIRRHEVLLRPARTSDLPPEHRARVTEPDPGRGLHPALAHAICFLWLMLLLPLAACVLVAWLAATVLALLWAVLGASFRRNEHLTLD